MNYVGFIDETGNTAQERFFGIGLLIVPEIDVLYDRLKPIVDQIRDTATKQRQQRVKVLVLDKKYDELEKIAHGGKTFELKYTRISHTNKALVTQLVDEYMKVPSVRFTAIIVDKGNPNFTPTKVFPGTWEAYVTYAGLVLAREVANLTPNCFSVLVDEISKPSTVETSLEYDLHAKFKQYCQKRNIQTSCNFHPSRVESNTHLLLQMVDILLGNIVLDYKVKHGLASAELLDRRGDVLNAIKNSLGRRTLAESFTVHKPNYFSVWEMDWK